MRNEIDRANELYVLALRQQSSITFHPFFSTTTIIQATITRGFMTQYK